MPALRTHRKAGERLARRICAPYRIDGLALQVTAAVGAAVFPHEAQTADDLLRAADRAMYAAKALATAAPQGPGKPEIPTRRREDGRSPS